VLTEIVFIDQNQMNCYPCPIDFAQAWHDCTAQDPSHRGAAAVDLAYWHTHAAGYDEPSRAPGYYEETLAAIQALVNASDTLLDVGAAAGRFALPLARCVRRVTALDHARPMLAILQQKVEQQAITNLTLVEAAWEVATVEPHDVVLAAWSLYRLPDILASIKKLIAATRRTLIVVAGAGHSGVVASGSPCRVADCP
jgi:2-polyprenyl-3-methyl-5-hydroxy-6-metoxy-1,4-benzoquinol methylase